MLHQIKFCRVRRKNIFTILIRNEKSLEKLIEIFKNKFFIKGGSES